MAKCDTGYGLQVASHKWQVAVVTGAASGLGFEFTKLLAADSFDLILIDIDGEKLKEVKQSIEETYRVDVEIIVCDLSKPHIISDIYRPISHRDIDVLINSAGFGLVGFFPETEWQIEEAMIHLHIISTTHLTKLVVKDMLTRGKGRIMNVASLAALIPGPLMAVYYATKAYLLSFSTALANEIKGKPVTVTTLCPGLTRTNFQKTVAQYSGCKANDSAYFTATPQKLASSGYKDMMAGKTVSIPGLRNKLLYSLCRIMPRSFSVSVMRRVQEKIRE